MNKILITLVGLLFAISVQAQNDISLKFIPRFDPTLTSANQPSLNNLKWVRGATIKSSQTDTTEWATFNTSVALDTLLSGVIYSTTVTDSIQFLITYQFGVSNTPIYNATTALMTDSLANLTLSSGQNGYTAKSKALWSIRPPGSNQVRMIVKQVVGTGSYLATPTKKYWAAIVTRMPVALQSTKK